jgi:hypothetical protein
LVEVVIMNDLGVAALVILSALTACGDSADPWCAASSTPGEKIRKSPDRCSSTKSVSPPFSSEMHSDFCVECTPRCGASKYVFNGDEYYTDTDLPAGACSEEGEQCEMGAIAPLAKCDGVVVGCALNEYRCTCSHGEWKCVMTSQGAGACSCEDGGAVDAGRQ